MEDFAGLARKLGLTGHAFGLTRRKTRKLACLRFALGHAFAEAPDAVSHLHGDPAGNAAGPHQLERRELPPGLIAVDDGAGEQIAGHGGGVEPLPAEARGEPDAGAELADLRHAVHGAAERAGPGV